MSGSKSVRTVHWWIQRIRTWLGWVLIWPAIRGAVKPLQRHRVPVILQMNSVECSAACLAMILSFYGRKTAISECREGLGTGRDGASALAIAGAARNYGLRVKALSLEPADFQYLRFPAIAHWNFNHFVVVERWSPKAIDIVDPGDGRRRLTAEEFDAGFTGVVLAFEPGVHFQRRDRAARLAWPTYLRGILGTAGVKGVLLQILGASLFLQVLGLAAPILTKVLVDQVLPFRMTNMMAVLGVGMGLLVLNQMVTGYLRAALLIFLQARLDAQMMLGFFEHVLALPFRFFQQRSSGDLMLRLGSNTMIREMLSSQTVSAILDGTFVLVYLGILLVWQPSFGLLALGLGVLEVALVLGTSRRVHRLMQRDLSAEAESQGYLVQALSGIATLKASGTEDRALDHWSNLFFNQLNISLQRNHLSAVIDTAMLALRTLAPLVLLWMGALYVLDGRMSLGTMLALTALASSFLTPLAALVSNGQRLQLVGAHLDRIADVVEAAPEQELQAVQVAPQLSGRIELKGVGFRYDPNAPAVLRDISLRIKPGQKVALVGRTGSGKSTLAMLLLGLYQPAEGEILYDDLPLERLNYRTLRSQFGVVLQESILFSGSIRQNIAFNDPTLSLEQVMEAARLAAIHDEILQMPMGYETLVAEGGTSFSGGQRQRLSLARALAHKPTILLLDEATSHLDVMTEGLIEQNLSNLACTRIVIAHRLSTIRNADLILVLDNGVIVEGGSHEELLAQSGYYAQLVRSQLRGEVPDVTSLAVAGEKLMLLPRV
jgi:ATP-binding cassette subfamily B protein